MLLTITTTHYPATDLGFLLHKHPGRLQTTELSAGYAHVFYPVADEEQCTAALLLDIDPVGLVRKSSPKGNDFALAQYVNDRPYVAGSFMSAAIAKAFSSALNGNCRDKPELAEKALPFTVKIAVLHVKGGENVLKQLFEPLGYTLSFTRHNLDSVFTEWGPSNHYTVELQHTITLKQLLSHLYILMPVCDTDKHYWLAEAEVEKLMSKGTGWLENHPSRAFIVRRYLKNLPSLANRALSVLISKDESEPEPESVIDAADAETAAEPGTTAAPDAPAVLRQNIHELRLQTAKAVIIQSGARRVADLGCGEGKLLKLLLSEKQFDFILGMDVSLRSLEIAKERLNIEKLPERQAARISLIHGALTYRDKRLNGFDAAALIEVIEHLDESRLSALEKSVFGYARPRTIVVTTPNAEYNVRFTDHKEGQMRHKDHRFEWTRAQFAAWAAKVSSEYGYSFVLSAVGEEDAELGALSQMAVFTNSYSGKTPSPAGPAN
ncbi:MAG: 3' terminal RNA ribose 2'-O-methyltransferase Hen1 [Bacteroidota bacterium]